VSILEAIVSTGRKYTPMKESRGWYLVEYHPPLRDSKTATLSLVITVEHAPEVDIVNAMEKELRDWLNRYPVPLLVFAFDNMGDLCSLGTLQKYGYLTGFFDQDAKIRSYWGPLEDKEIPDVALNRKYVDQLYSAFDYKTYAELDVDRQRRRRGIKIGYVVLVAWLVVIPLLIAILDYYTDLLALPVLLYSFYKGIRKWLELRGKWPKSSREKQRELEERLKDHYYYHCQMNPEGFKRLMRENLDEMRKDEIAREAEALRKPNA